MAMPNMHKPSYSDFDTTVFSPILDCFRSSQQIKLNNIQLETFILDDSLPQCHDKDSDLMQILNANHHLKQSTPTPEKHITIEEKIKDNLVLKPFLLKDFEKPEIAFDYQKNQTKQRQRKIWKIINSNNFPKDRKRKDYDKNICRYIARQVIRCFVSEDYEDQVILLCNNEEKLYCDVTNYFLSRIEFITGHRALKEILSINEDDSEETTNFKVIFRKFFKWFLKHRAMRYIIQGNMIDKLSYIRFKNEIMLHYIDRPERWNSNKVKHSTQPKQNISIKKEEDDMYC